MKKNEDTKAKKNALTKSEVDVFGGMRQEEANKKIRSMFFPVLGTERKKCCPKIQECEIATD